MSPLHFLVRRSCRAQLNQACERALMIFVLWKHNLYILILRDRCKLLAPCAKPQVLYSEVTLTQPWWAECCRYDDQHGQLGFHRDHQILWHDNREHGSSSICQFQVLRFQCEGHFPHFVSVHLWNVEWCSSWIPLLQDVYT